MKIENRLIRINLVNSVVIILLLILSIGGMILYTSHNELSLRVDDLEKRYIDAKQRENTNAIEHTASFIRFKKEESYRRARARIDRFVQDNETIFQSLVGTRDAQLEKRIEKHLHSLLIPGLELKIRKNSDRSTPLVEGWVSDKPGNLRLTYALAQWGLRLDFILDRQAFEASVQHDILETLRSIRFGHDKGGYIFVMELLDIHGGPRFAREILLPVNPDREGQFLSDDATDTKGRAYRKTYLEQLRDKGEATVQYTYIKEKNGEAIEKLSYLRLLPEWNWVIGTGTYLDQLETIKLESEARFEDQLQDKLLSLVLVFILFGSLAAAVAHFFGQRLKTAIREYQGEIAAKETLLGQYRHAVDQTSLFSKTDLDGNITYVNDLFCETSGYSREELIGHKHNIVKNPDVPVRIYTELWETITAKKIWQGTIKNRRKDGSDYIIDATIFPILDVKGEIVEYISIRKDITELEEYKNLLEDQLDLSNSKLVESFQRIREYEKAIDAGTAFLRIYTDGTISAANDTLCELIRRPHEAILGQPFDTICLENGGYHCFIDMERIKQREIIRTMLLFVDGDGRTIHINAIFVPIVNVEKEVEEIMVICHDITEIVELGEEIEATQREVVLTMGAIGESRSNETGQHVKRVAEYSRLLALYSGMEEAEAELVKQASPMHDIGKVAIPDAILNKPGRLDPKEWKVMMTHARLGYDMLHHSERPILKAAALIAQQHHEKWDGTGYPAGLAGEDIHIYGRITALADVFDALGSDRCYKKAWDDEQIFRLFKEESGRHFDPALVAIFFEHLDEFLEVRETYRDQ